MREDTFKSQMVILAKEKGFRARLNPKSNSYEYYLWLRGLQKWLNDKHKLMVVDYPYKDHGDDVNDDVRFKFYIYNHKVKTDNKEFKHREDSLEQGCKEALELIVIPERPFNN